MATRPKSILAVASVVILLATSVGGGAARAQDDAQKQIDASIKQAIALRKEGKDREALDELHRAARLGHSPRLSAQTGFAEQALGLWVPAEKDLRDALAESSDPWIRKNRRTLEESLANVGGHLASVDIWGPPDGAQILIDGEPAGALPLSAPIRVPADTVEVTVRADGFVPAKRKLELSPGANVREHVVLHAIDVDASAAARRRRPPRSSTWPRPIRRPNHRQRSIRPSSRAGGSGRSWPSSSRAARPPPCSRRARTPAAPSDLHQLLA